MRLRNGLALFNFYSTMKDCIGPPNYNLIVDKVKIELVVKVQNFAS